MAVIFFIRPAKIALLYLINYDNSRFFLGPDTAVFLSIMHRVYKHSGLICFLEKNMVYNKCNASLFKLLERCLLKKANQG